MSGALKTFRRPLVPRAGLSLSLALAGLALLCSGGGARGGGLPGYAGSETCRECHGGIYDQWSRTPHSRMRRDTSKFPNAVAAGKFSPEIPFRKKDIAFTIGSHWIQKYLTVIDGDLYVLPKYWNLTKQDWEPYSIFNWRNKPYSVNCYGCHTVGFDPETRTHFEDAIGCESCHGPGKKHTGSQEAADIVNPARLEKKLADMICEACHTDGNDRGTGEFPFAAGFQPGRDISEFYTDFFLPKPGSKKWYRGDSTYEDRHRMMKYYETEFYSKKRACGV
jgi:hypothetical protein